MNTKTDLYADLTRPEHEAWKKHKNVLGALTPNDAVFRGCVGLAMLIDSQTADSWIDTGDKRTFVHDKRISWASMVDVPPGYFQVGNDRRRPVSWATVRGTSMKFGVPRIERGTEGYRAWDFRALKRTHASDLPVLEPDREPQLFRCFNAINWAMSSVGFSFNRDWEYAKPVFGTALADMYDVKPSKVMLVAGNGVYDGVAHPEQWMPRPYIGFREQMRDEVFDRATMRPHERYSYSLCDAFLTALADGLAYRARFEGTVQNIKLQVQHRGMPCTEIHLAGDRGEHEVVRFMAGRCRVAKGIGRDFKRGDVIAEEKLDAKLPRDWHTTPVEVRMNDRATCPVARLLGRHLDPAMRLWFSRQGVELVDGLVHFPVAISSVAALSTAVDTSLFWEVSEALDYYRDDCDALVFPPIPCDRWFHTRGWLPGDVEYDLTPVHSAFITFEDLRARLRAQGPKDKKSKDRLKKKLDKNVRDREKKAEQLRGKK